MKILVVDDSRPILNLIKHILTAHKHEVETAENGAQALDKYVKFKPAIVTLDLTMPIMNGYETLKKILALDKNANIIMLTASEQKTDIERCLQKGALGYIEKPFTAKDLVSGIVNAERAGSDKNIVTLFSLLTNKIEDIFRKMLNHNVSIILSHVEVIEQISNQVQLVSLYKTYGSIRAVPEIQETLQIEAPFGAIGFVNEIGGQQNGMVVSFMQEKDLLALFNLSGFYDSQSEQILEFFNIVNTKVLSEIANSTQLILNIEPPRLYDISKDKPITNGIKATFEIMSEMDKIVLEVQAWLDLRGIFRRRF